MGVPRFYKWLRTRYPQIRMDLTDSNKQIPIIDNLYLDFNGIVYRCIADFQCFLKNKFDPISIEEIYQRVFIYMLMIIEKVNPQKLLFIGFDGVAPRAKINQSRDRRFRAIKDRQKLYDLLQKLNIKDNQNFQINSISPGTDFLTKLCSFLKTKVMDLYQTDWRHLKIFFSDCLTPGQGEHKIMDFLRHSKRLKLFQPTTTHCVYSADADVILLTISLNIQNICIIRQDAVKQTYGFVAATNVRNFKSAQFQFIFVSILRQYFRKQFAQCLQQLQTKDVQPIINDFILLMAFVGNDFLPVQFCFTIKQAHMQNLFRSYKQYLTAHKKFINNNGVIDWTGIQQLLQIAKKFQANMVQQKVKNKRNLISQRQYQKQSVMQPIRQSKQTQQYDNQNNQDDQVQNFQVKDNKIIKGKQLYYKTRFNIDDISTDPKFKDIIIKYIQGLQFYNQYYFLGVPSWTWGYPYHYTPLLTDVYQYISNNKVNVKLNKGQPFDPFLALMFMLPQPSFKILPKSLADVLTDPKCQLRTPVDYYPSQFKLDKYQSLQFHKRALIPFLNQNQVKKVYQSVDRNKYNDFQKQKNGKTNTVYYKFIGNVMHGSEIYFGNQDSEKELVQFCKQQTVKYKQINKQKQNTKDRFPNLSLYGNFQLDERGKIVVQRKYKHQGNPNQIAFYNNFIGFVQQSLPCPQQFHSQIQIAYREIGIDGKCTNLYKVKQARRLRQIGRFSLIKTNNQVRVPDFALFKLPKWQYIPQIYNFQMKDIYTQNQRVIILNNKYFGYIGSIQKLQQKQSKIKLLQPSYTTNHKIQQNQQQFYSLENIADQFQLDPQVILTLLDEVLILPKTNNKNQFDDVFPTAVNMGLNIINSAKGLILPYYVRCQMEYQNTIKIYQIFKNIQISQSCKQVLSNYIQNFAWVVDYIQDCVKEGDFTFRKGIYARNIFGKQPNINIKLYQQFVKLYKLGVEGQFYSIYSKVANKQIPSINPTQRIKQTISLPYHQFISKKQAKICPPALRSQPQFHDIGDRVILLKTFQVGYIIGIDDFKVIVKLPKRNQLVCVHFIDAFNQKWGNYLMKQPGKCWDMNLGYFSPAHYTKAKKLNQE